MDRFTRGFFAGSLAALIQLPFALTVYALHLTDLLWLNFSSVMIYGRMPSTLGEKVFAGMGVMFFSGLVGIVFAYIIISVSSQNHLFKGVVFGEAVWFFAFAVTLLFKVPELAIINLKTAIANFVLAATWGTLTADILRRLNARYSEVK